MAISWTNDQRFVLQPLCSIRVPSKSSERGRCIDMRFEVGRLAFHSCLKGHQRGRSIAGCEPCKT